MTADLIIISEINDGSTNQVLEYLNYFGFTNYVRLNAEETVIIELIELTESGINIIINYQNKPVLFNKSKVIWYRRGDFKYQHRLLITDNDNLNTQLNGFLRQEWIKLRDFILSIIPYTGSGKLLGNIQDEIYCNKLSNLTIAGQIGFKIPQTIVTSSKERLKQFTEGKKKIITKPVSNIPTFKYKNESWCNRGNSIVKQSDIDNLNNLFYPLLVQEYIDKEFEIRVFFFDEIIFAMAIFSQNDSGTNVDYRNYNYSKPNRVVPIQLSATTNLNIRSLIRELNVFSGSIDLIQHPSGQIYFLEINYFGQFDWLSHNCNYYIEQQIAEYILSCTSKASYLMQ